jgi:hypothetical protein
MTSGCSPSSRSCRVDHVLLRAADALPAIVVVQQPGGATHFIVVWGAYGLGREARWVQVMDPASGRHVIPASELLSQLFVHRMGVPTADWHAWATSEDFAAPLLARLQQLGVKRRQAVAHYQQAVAADDWRAVASLDAAVRMSAELTRSGGLRRGADVSAFVSGLVL